MRCYRNSTITVFFLKVKCEVVDVPLCKMYPPDPLVNLTDSSYAPSKNEKTRRSVSGRCHYHLAGFYLISWQSELQPLTAASAHEAELIAMASCSDESIW